LKTAGREKTFHVVCPEHNNTMAKMRAAKEMSTWEAHEAKTCRDRTSVVWHKMLKTVYKYASLTIKHIAELSFICEPQQKLVSCQQQCSTTHCQQLHNGGGKAWEHMAVLNRSLDHFTCPQRVPKFPKCEVLIETAGKTRMAPRAVFKNSHRE